MSGASHSKKVLLTQSWYESRLHDAVLRYAVSHNWTLDSDHHDGHPPSFTGYDGVIVLTACNQHRRMLRREYDGPMVELSNADFGSPVARVLLDQVEAGRYAARCLLARGFRQFAFIGDHNMWYTPLREQGFVEEIADAGFGDHCITLDVRTVIRSKKGLRGEMGAIVRRIAPLPAGVFLAVGRFCDRAFLKTCEAMEVDIPAELALITMDNDPLFCPHASIPLSSVDPNYEEQGYCAAALLNGLMSGKDAPLEPVLVAPRSVVERRSSDSFAIDNKIVALALRYLWDHARVPIRVDDVAQHVNVSRSVLQLAFRKTLRQSIKEVWQKKRMELICKELRETNRRIQNISDEFNFDSPAYFARVFKRETGMTARNFRRRGISPE